MDVGFVMRTPAQEAAPNYGWVSDENRNQSRPTSRVGLQGRISERYWTRREDEG